MTCCSSNICPPTAKNKCVCGLVYVKGCMRNELHAEGEVPAADNGCVYLFAIEFWWITWTKGDLT